MDCVDVEEESQTPIHEILQRLPEEIREWVRDNVIFFDPADWEAGCAVTHDFRQPTSGLRMVYIAPESHRWSRTMREALVVHEIARLWCPEQQPCEQAIAWGFADGILELKNRGWLDRCADHAI